MLRGLVGLMLLITVLHAIMYGIDRLSDCHTTCFLIGHWIDGEHTHALYMPVKR